MVKADLDTLSPWPKGCVEATATPDRREHSSRAIGGSAPPLRLSRPAGLKRGQVSDFPIVTRGGNPVAPVELPRMHWWMYALIAVAVLVLLNVLLVVIHVVFGRYDEFGPPYD